ncbi:MAG TPA: DUF3090 family protein [Bellilinea sp.]|nr:DUF3090 family protein [Bellilinea sp.]
MPGIEKVIKPTTRLTADAIGKPGSRVFYLHGESPSDSATLLIEKIQLQNLAMGVIEIVQEIDERNPELSRADGTFYEERMHLEPPLDPLFRVAELNVAYELETDFVILTATEIAFDDPGNEPLSTVQFWTTRSIVLQLANWIVELASRGRPICPQCGQPYEPGNHFCPKKNGHKKH